MLVSSLGKPPPLTSSTENTMSHRKRFHEQDRVELSPEGLAANLGPSWRYNADLRGTVTRVKQYGPTVASLTVLIDGRKTTSSFHSAFWKLAR